LLTLSYTIMQFAVLILFWPALLLLVLARPKYRRRIPARLGFGLGGRLQSVDRGRPAIWVHALSVGEITSAAPLIGGLRRKYPECFLVVTASTASGEDVARHLLGTTADLILPAPLDLLPVVQRFIRLIRPEMFILVETDFWPALLTSLSRKKIPMLLVNGRISQKSFAAYKKYSFFFLPMFRRFQHICLQTEREKEKFEVLGIERSRLHTLGNLKYDLHRDLQSAPPTTAITALLPAGRFFFVAASTHPGEEEIILEVYRRVRLAHPALYLILVPRRPERADKILEAGLRLRLTGCRRTDNPTEPADYLLVDTIGELVELYGHCHLAFIGGSLVAAGGHNPLEPARIGVPVLYGPHMEDFQEIAADLIASGGARTVADVEELAAVLGELIENNTLCRQMGSRSRDFVEARQGVVSRHLDLIATLLP